MSSSAPPIEQIRQRIAAAAGPRRVDLLAVSKTRSADEVRALAVASGQRAFGENYVQEAIAKREALADLELDWHLIGHLQSNKCREAAETFDWIASIDRAKLISALARFRPADRDPLNLLIQVNVDDEQSKSGCQPEQVAALARAIVAEPRLRLRLRGLMAIPAPGDSDSLARAFERMRELFDALGTEFAGVDTLSMGMSDDFPLAIAHGATQVRIGTALFGPRPYKIP